MTEVFFSNHTNLPATYLPGETYTINFTIVNKEGRDISYPFAVIQEGGLGRTNLASGNVLVANGQAITHQISVVYTDSGPSARVIISLPEQSQSLQYLTVRRAG